MPRQDLRDRFVSVLKDLGGSAGNGRLREALGWTPETYDGVREALLATGAIERGRGRGGSVSRAAARRGCRFGAAAAGAAVQGQHAGGAAALLDAGWLDRAAFETAWAAEGGRLRGLAERGRDGGAFYRTTLSRVSRRFARALVESTLEGQTLYRDGLQMLGVGRTAAFDRIARAVEGST